MFYIINGEVSSQPNAGRDTLCIKERSYWNTGSQTDMQHKLGRYTIYTYCGEHNKTEKNEKNAHRM